MDRIASPKLLQLLLVLHLLLLIEVYAGVAADDLEVADFFLPYIKSFSQDFMLSASPNKKGILRPTKVG
jgi:hypothetical protein